MADLYGSQDVTLRNDDGTKTVTVITDGAIERLAVASREQPATNYQLKSDIDTTGDSVGTTDVTLYSFTGAGVVDYVGVIDANSSNYEVAIVIDSVERFRITQDNLGSVLGMTDTNAPLSATNANKKFTYQPTQGIGFSTNFSIIARATTGTRTLQHIVLYREQVV